MYSMKRIKGAEQAGSTNLMTMTHCSFVNLELEQPVE
jgi:hypothetical protein